jgi:hypothetical protein
MLLRIGLEVAIGPRVNANGAGPEFCPQRNVDHVFCPSFGRP